MWELAAVTLEPLESTSEFASSWFVVARRGPFLVIPLFAILRSVSVSRLHFVFLRTG